MKGLMIAAPASGSGKTTVALGLLRALKRRGVALAPVKAGPDYIDAGFLTAASGAPCYNLDAWAMRPELISALSSRMTEGSKLLVVEGRLGLFDAATQNQGSSADLAKQLDLPVILVVDCHNIQQSVAALVSGYSSFRRDIFLAGIVLNRVESAEHELMLRTALQPLGIPVVGAIPTDETLLLETRYLGLVQAVEHDALDRLLDSLADTITARLDMKVIEHIWSRPNATIAMANIPRLKPMGQRIAVARDAAFTFAYQHILEAWRRRGAEISFFSPLANEAPARDADAIYLPGGYPELHTEQLAQADLFKAAIQNAAQQGRPVYGECGGYMVLGKTIEDEMGKKHPMLGLLPLETSFLQKKEYLGYRVMEPLAASPWEATMRGHELRCANIVSEGKAARLFKVRDALGNYLGEAGLRVGSVKGSFMHVIDIVGDGL